MSDRSNSEEDSGVPNSDVSESHQARIDMKGPKEHRKWIKEMNKTVSSFAISQANSELSVEDLQKVAEEYSKLFLEIKSQHRAIMACIKSSEKENRQHAKGLEHKYNLLYPKAYEFHVLLEELTKEKAAISASNDVGFSETASEDMDGDQDDIEDWSSIISDDEEHIDADSEGSDNEDDQLSKMNTPTMDDLEESYPNASLFNTGASVRKQRVIDNSKFSRSNKKSEHCATFYFKHSETDEETMVGALTPQVSDEDEVFVEESWSFLNAAVEVEETTKNPRSIRKKISSKTTRRSQTDCVWDDYLETYFSENYSEGYDSDAARRLLEFGDDYEEFLGSELEIGTSDLSSSITGETGLKITPRLNRGSPSSSDSSMNASLTTKKSDKPKRPIAVAHRKLNFEKVEMSPVMCPTPENQLRRRKPNNKVEPEITSDEDDDFLTVRTHHVQPEDFTEIITTCRNNVRCLQAVLQGNPGSVYAANTIRRANGELALLIHVECKCYPITRFIARVFDYIFDFSQILMNFTLYRFFISTMRGFYDLLNLKKSTFERMCRYIMW